MFLFYPRSAQPPAMDGAVGNLVMDMYPKLFTLFSYVYLSIHHSRDGMILFNTGSPVLVDSLQ